MNLETTYLGLKLAHPVIAGASPLTATLDGIRRLEDAGAAAVVTASLYEEEILAEEEAMEAVRLAGAESHPEVTHYLPPKCGCHGPLDGHIETIRRAAESVSMPVIASLNAATQKGWINFARDLQTAGAAAIELNFFRIPIDPAETSSDLEQGLIKIVRDVRGAVQIPLAVKLGPFFSAPVHLAGRLADAGANGLVLFNRFYGPDIDLDIMMFRPTLELSAPSEIRLPLKWIALLAGRTPLSLSASGGVAGPDEVVKYLLAGADTVQTASAVLRHGPDYLARLVDGLTRWLEARGATSVSQIRGRLRADRLVRPGVLLRAQPTPAMLLECPCQDSDTLVPRHSGERIERSRAPARLLPDPSI